MIDRLRHWGQAINRTIEEFFVVKLTPYKWLYFFLFVVPIGLILGYATLFPPRPEAINGCYGAGSTRLAIDGKSVRLFRLPDIVTPYAATAVRGVEVTRNGYIVMADRIPRYDAAQDRITLVADKDIAAFFVRDNDPRGFIVEVDGPSDTPYPMVRLPC